MPSKSAGNPVIPRNERIGYLDAETDRDYFLNECFVSTEQYRLISDIAKPERIVIGRTGSGKTALLDRVLSENENAIEFDPEALSLNYISNSTVIQFFEEAGIHLDPFYKLLWLHVICVELIQKKFHISSPSDQSNFISSLMLKVASNSHKKAALKYLEDWGGKFWERTHMRVQEITEKVEKQIEGSLGAKFSIVSAGAKGAATLSTETKTEIQNLVKDVISDTQTRELLDLVRLMKEEIFTDDQQSFFVIIDRLDEEWTDEKIKPRLLKALLEAVRQLRKIGNVKVIVALREDLVARVFDQATSPGFQKDKYDSLTVRLSWTEQELKTLLEKRVQVLFQRKYTNSHVGLVDIIADAQIERLSIIDYLISRTFMRPRDVILFMNLCLAEASSKEKVSRTNLLAAEKEYSKNRIDALEYEWRTVYPFLKFYIQTLNGHKPSFALSDIDLELIENGLIYDLIAQSDSLGDPLQKFITDLVENGSLDTERFICRILEVFYKIGLVGVKLNANEGYSWSHINSQEIDLPIYNSELPIKIHPAFWHALNCKTQA